jgi:hemerythrin-like domain-containing protein
MHEHRIIERVLRSLSGMCVRMEREEKVPPEAIAQAIGFIRTFADGCHHAKEEKHLFPALERRGVPRQGGPVGVMLHEHDLGRALIAEMDRSAKALVGGDQEAGEHFVAMTRRYIELLTQHIAKEDQVLFQIARQVFDEQAFASLAEAFERAEAETGAGTHEQLEELAASLERTWAVSGADR